MQLPQGRRRGPEFWKEHLKAAAKFSGTDKEYCEKHGLNPKYFSLNKKKLGFPLIPRGKAGKSFSTIKVIEEPKIMAQENTQLDPVWLARFLKEIFSK